MGRRNKKKIFSIILVNHGKQFKSVCSETTETKIYKRFNEIIKENKNVVFPVKYNNAATKEMIESEYEIVIIKCKQENDSHVNKVRDEYGKFVDYQTNDEDWIVVDRAPYYIEETFWVYGFHPRIQRKDFNWIFDNFIAKDADDKYKMKTIVLYLNKLLVECNGKLEMVICKNKSDCIRLYNQIEEYSKNRKFKYNVFIGDIDESRYKSSWMDKIQELTHWSRLKIKRNSTKP
jgi:hypothetical protein